jgi:hypothetical protein
MLCPVCTDTTLLMTERQGVEIDYCPKCRGVWLDRGELDKLIAMSSPREDSTPKKVDPPNNQRPPAEFNIHPSAQPYGGYPADGYRPDNYRPDGYRPEADRSLPSDRHDHQRHPEYHKPKKRESWLGELFDWD